MRRLLLIRHAKSSWNYPQLSDHDRPLNKRGERDAPLMAQRLDSRGEQLDAVISSTAVRALAIAQSISQQLSIPLVGNPNLYTFSSRQLYQELLNIPESYKAVAIVSHNPAITDVANELLKGLTDNVPTSGIVAIACDTDHWHKLTADTCRKEYFDYPKRRDH